MQLNRVTRVLAVAVPAVVVAVAVAYGLGYLNNTPSLQFVESDEDKKKKAPIRSISKDTASREDVIRVLDDVLAIQHEITRTISRITTEIVDKELTIAEVYERVYDASPGDPLEMHGLTINDFDALLDRFQSDDDVHKRIMAVLSGPESANARPLQNLNVQKVIELNVYMRDRLRDAIADLHKCRPTLTKPYKPNIASLTLQALVSAHLQRFYSITPDEIDRIMMYHQFELSANTEFLKTSEETRQMLESVVNEQSE